MANFTVSSPATLPPDVRLMPEFEARGLGEIGVTGTAASVLGREQGSVAAYCSGGGPVPSLSTSYPYPPMSLMLALPVAAVGYSLVYMLLGGGIFGAIVIFVVAKMFRR